MSALQQRLDGFKNLPAHTVTKAELITAGNVDTLNWQLGERSRGASSASVGGREPDSPGGS